MTIMKERQCILHPVDEHVRIVPNLYHLNSKCAGNKFILMQTGRIKPAAQSHCDWPEIQPVCHSDYHSPSETSNFHHVEQQIIWQSRSIFRKLPSIQRVKTAITVYDKWHERFNVIYVRVDWTNHHKKILIWDLMKSVQAYSLHGQSDSMSISGTNTNHSLGIFNVMTGIRPIQELQGFSDIYKQKGIYKYMSHDWKKQTPNYLLHK